MKGLKERIWALLADGDEAEEEETACAEIAAEVSEAEDTTDEDEAADELPIYSATPAEISYWHASGCNVFLQNLLGEYDLNYFPTNAAAYDHFKIGLDEKRHVATFAIDETHYYAIQFNERNTEPVNRAEAKRVLEKISELRYSRQYFTEFCGVMLERFA